MMPPAGCAAALICHCRPVIVTLLTVRLYRPSSLPYRIDHVDNGHQIAVHRAILMNAALTARVPISVVPPAILGFLRVSTNEKDAW
jgi:hypothetical protein